MHKMTLAAFSAASLLALGLLGSGTYLTLNPPGPPAQPPKPPGQVWFPLGGFEVNTQNAHPQKSTVRMRPGYRTAGVELPT